MKNIYNEYLALNEDGRAMMDVIDPAITEIFNQLVKKGYSPHDIAYWICHEASSQQSIIVTTRAIKMRQAKKNRR